ncbi:hypothetical protein BDV29DRAFT_156464 [Aspergillus leporis]|uniref:F-box domain-containing protein n=1 Tax=Aspergillus leporis TaxID=41062 RepID=A0A5N5X1F9_9EURO|nr:hypothetical protein BDV29DRAFT_156464 [Aspergillus leporis]
MPARKEQREPWPNLKALYLREEDDDWLRRLSRFEELQVLSLRFASGIPAINRGAIEEIAKCQHLRAIELGLHELDDVEVLLNIARCPPLRKFSVPFFVQQEMEEDLLLGLLRALSYLEFFELGLKFRMDGAILHELACRCPRLTVLELHQTRLCLTLAQIENICRFPQLKVMRVKRLRFKNSRRLIQRRKVKITATEWRRIYPKLQNMPCPADIYSLQTVRDDSNEESEYTASVSSDDEESPREPGVDFNDYASDWFTLQTKLWRALGYGEDLNSPDRIPYIW